MQNFDKLEKTLINANNIKIDYELFKKFLDENFYLIKDKNKSYFVDEKGVVATITEDTIVMYFNEIISSDFCGDAIMKWYVMFSRNFQINDLKTDIIVVDYLYPFNDIDVLDNFYIEKTFNPNLEEYKNLSSCGVIRLDSENEVSAVLRSEYDSFCIRNIRKSDINKNTNVNVVSVNSINNFVNYDEFYRFCKNKDILHYQATEKGWIDNERIAWCERRHNSTIDLENVFISNKALGEYYQLECEYKNNSKIVKRGSIADIDMILGNDKINLLVRVSDNDELDKIEGVQDIDSNGECAQHILGLKEEQEIMMPNIPLIWHVNKVYNNLIDKENVNKDKIKENKL